MSGGAPPLRFLLLVVGGWICVRGAYLADDWWTPPPNPQPRPSLANSVPAGGVVAPGPAAEAVALSGRQERVRPVSPPRLPPLPPSTVRPPLTLVAAAPRQATPLLPTIRAFAPAVAPAAAAPLAPSSGAPAIAPTAAQPPRPSRWSGSAWVHQRHGGYSPLAPGGTLGGSQAGLRINYRLHGNLALSGRLYMPLRRPQGTEVALGVDWRPLRAVPIHLLAERRQRVGREGRSDFALTLYGGVSERRLPAGLRLDAYAQAGVVGARERDLFFDGSARISVRSAALDLGGGVWGAAQPGVSRLDVGPQASLRLPAAGANLRLSADWRFRVAGGGAPASGPTLTLATDF